jgi:alkaline phosphatase
MKRNRILLICLFLIIAATIISSAVNINKTSTPVYTPGIFEKRPKNIILLIGDGMGLTQISAGLYSNHNHLNLERFPFTGLIKTNAHKRLITDSGAAATSFACGCKTYNGAIGVNKNKKPCLSILEQASQNGLATGLIASSSITHATPAAFIAHVPDRADMEGIAPFFLQTKLDLLIGGGLSYFRKRRSDTLNLYRQMLDAGYQMTNYTENKLSSFKPAGDRPFAWFSADEEPESVENGRDYLPLAAELAGPFLKKRSTKGFFLMLEGSQIDWACHKNNGPYAIKEMLDFDAAIGAILKFAEADGETLVIVTADHETGGMAIKQGSEMDSLTIAFSTDQHTATMVPIFAYGPGAELFSGIFENTEVFFKMQALFGFPATATDLKK